MDRGIGNNQGKKKKNNNQCIETEIPLRFGFHSELI